MRNSKRQQTEDLDSLLGVIKPYLKYSVASQESRFESFLSFSSAFYNLFELKDLKTKV